MHQEGKSHIRRGDQVPLNANRPTFDPESADIEETLDRLNTKGVATLRFVFHVDQSPDERNEFVMNFCGQLSDLSYQMLGRGLIPGSTTSVTEGDRCTVFVPVTAIDYRLSLTEWDGTN
jgi:hypothetical protein